MVVDFWVLIFGFALICDGCGLWFVVAMVEVVVDVASSGVGVLFVHK